MAIDITKLTIEEIIDLKLQLDRVKVAPYMPTESTAVLKRRLAEAEKWDWSKNNFEVAAEHGLHYGTANRYRNILGKERVYKHFPACKSWDWTKSNAEISRTNGVAITYVNLLRKKLGQIPAPRDYVPLPQPPRPVFSAVDYSDWDFEKTDSELGREHGFTREYCRQIRIKLGKPKCRDYDRRLKRFDETFKDQSELDYQSVKAVFPCALETFKRLCFRSGKKAIFCNPKKHAWHLMNWNLPTSVLSRIWGISIQVISNQRTRFSNALFHCKKQNVPEQYKPLVEAEEKKAAEWLANKS